MAALVSDTLWSVVEPLIPKRPPSPAGGRPPVPDRQALTGIIFVLRTGMAWNQLPAELGCGSGATCWRRLKAWTEAGVIAALLARILTVLGKAGRLNAARVIADSASVRAVLGGTTPARTPPTAANAGANATS